MPSVTPIKRPHRSLGTLVDAFSFQHLQHGHPEYFHIQPEGDVIYVVDVQLKLAGPADAVAAVHLRPASDAGPDLVAAVLLFGVEGQVFQQQRPWANDAHVSLQYIVQLRQFIQRSLADKITHPGHALNIGQQITLLVQLIGHGFELSDKKFLAAVARPLLAEEGAPTVLYV